MNDCPVTSVAPTEMQFLDVAGDVTVEIPLAFAKAAPSFPAANTGMKSCTISYMLHQYSCYCAD